MNNMDYFSNAFILLCLLQKCYGLSLDLRGSYGFIGDAVFLDCSLEGAAWSTSSTRQWRVYSPVTLLFDKGTPSSVASGYQEIISNASTTGKFSLEITNLTWSHIGKQFECKYVFGTADHILSSTEIEDHQNTNVHISEETDGLQIKGEITLDAIYPIPTVRAILTETKDVSTDALANRTSAASGNLTKVVIIVNYKVGHKSDYIKVHLSTPGGYSKFFTLNTDIETTTITNVKTSTTSITTEGSTTSNSTNKSTQHHSSSSSSGTTSASTYLISVTTTVQSTNNNDLSKSSYTTYIIIGSVGGSALLVLLCVAVVVLRRKFTSKSDSSQKREQYQM